MRLGAKGVFRRLVHVGERVEHLMRRRFDDDLVPEELHTQRYWSTPWVRSCSTHDATSAAGGASRPNVARSRSVMPSTEGPGAQLEHQRRRVVEVVHALRSVLVDDQAVGDLVHLEPVGPNGLVSRRSSHRAGIVGDVNPSTLRAVVGEQATDEPFSFGDYAAIETAQRLLGPVQVHAAHLPYGFWWDTLRPSIDLARDGDPPHDRLPLDGAWISAAVFVSRDDPRYEKRCGTIAPR